MNNHSRNIKMTSKWRQLFDAISKIVAQAELREQMGKSSYRRATSYFPNTVAVKLSEIYKNLLDV